VLLSERVKVDNCHFFSVLRCAAVCCSIFQSVAVIIVCVPWNEGRGGGACLCACIHVCLCVCSFLQLQGYCNKNE